MSHHLAVVVDGDLRHPINLPRSAMVKLTLKSKVRFLVNFPQIIKHALPPQKRVPRTVGKLIGTDNFSRVIDARSQRLHPAERPQSSRLALVPDKSMRPVPRPIQPADALAAVIERAD